MFDRKLAGSVGFDGASGQRGKYSIDSVGALEFGLGQVLDEHPTTRRGMGVSVRQGSSRSR